MPTIGDVVTSALSEIRIARAGDVVGPDDMARGVYVLNRLLNLWNADGRRVYATIFTDYTLTPSLSPHTIGPSGTFVMTERPVELVAAQLNLGGSPNAFNPIDVRDDAWFRDRGVPGFSSDTPTDVYYQPAWPLGKLYFYGVPSHAYGVRLWTNVALASVAATDDFALPQGYQAAIELTLAEELAPSFGQPTDQGLARRARSARAIIFADNDEAPRIATSNAGVPNEGGSCGGWFDINTRSYR